MGQRQFTLRTLLILVTLAGLLFGAMAWFTGLPDGPLRDWASSWLLYLLLGLPFALTGLMAWNLAQQTGSRRVGWWFVALSWLALGLNFYWAYSESQALVAQRLWTGAALTFAMVVPRSFGILLVCWIVRHGLGRSKQLRGKNSDTEPS